MNNNTINNPIEHEEKNFNRPNRMMAPRHTAWLDYMDLCKQYYIQKRHKFIFYYYN